MDAPKNLKLDDKLIEAAVKLGNFKTKQAAVNAALAEKVPAAAALAHIGFGRKNRFRPKVGLQKAAR